MMQPKKDGCDVPCRCVTLCGERGGVGEMRPFSGRHGRHERDCAWAFACARMGASQIGEPRTGMFSAILACELFPSVRCAGMRVREGGGSRGAGAFPPSEGEKMC